MNSGRIGICSYKFVELQLKTLRGLGTRMVLDNKEEFKKIYGNLLGILNTEVNTSVVHTLVQFYNPPMRCFTFQDYQLALTLEEYSHILGVGIKNRVPFFSTKELPKSHLISEAPSLEKKEVELNLKLKGGTHSFTLKFQIGKATDVGSWNALNVILALLMYGIVLFPNMEEFVDFASIHTIMTKNHVRTLLANTYYCIHVRNHKKKGTTMCCIPLLYKWFISHLPNKGPLIENKGNPKWSQRIMSLTGKDILWYSRSYDNVKVILNCVNFHNVTLLVTNGGTSYSLRLTLRQLGYPMLDRPDSKQLEDFVLYEGVDKP
ncbi:uncharacterized protein LOC127131953 [Lathyrus oleraceus]|uniref:uncharacterized protein LOC127131953 n=1 Tax=Pisum sativum TaxID=3888 RepID=UPI0021D1E8E9|nr:uncharacterized protein LOC127131953 [Pisum sativum]